MRIKKKYEKSRYHNMSEGKKKLKNTKKISRGKKVKI